MCLSCVAWMPRFRGIADSGEDPRTVAALGKILVLKHRNLDSIEALAEFLFVDVPVKLSLLNDAHYRRRMQELKQLWDKLSICRVLRFRTTTSRSSPTNDVFTQLRQGAGNQPNDGMSVFTSAVDLFMLATIAHCLTNRLI